LTLSLPGIAEAPIRTGRSVTAAGFAFHSALWSSVSGVSRSEARRTVDG